MDIDSDRDGGGAKRGTKRLFEGIEENDDCFKAYAQSRPRLRICPFQVFSEGDQITVLSLGAVLSDISGYCDTDNVFPVGYQALRSFPSARNPKVSGGYLLEIRFGGIPPQGGPVFHVKECEGDSEFVGHSPGDVWRDVVRSVRQAGLSQKDVDGNLMFGLSTREIADQVAALPGADKRARPRILGRGTSSLSPTPFHDSNKSAHRSGGRQSSRALRPGKQFKSAKEIKIEEKQRFAEAKERLKLDTADRKRHHDSLKQQEKEDKDRFKEQQRMERQRVQDELNRAKVERERQRFEERRRKEEEKVLHNIVARVMMIDDMELLALRAEMHIQGPGTQMGHGEELVEADPVPGGIEEHLLSDAIMVYEYVNFFADFLQKEPVQWEAFCTALRSDDCALFHGLHLILLQKLFADLKAENGFLGRPLNALTWPEVMRQYLCMLQQEHIQEGRHECSDFLQLENACLALEASEYHYLPLETRLELLVLNIDLVLETSPMRQYIDSLCDGLFTLQAEKRQEHLNLAKEARLKAMEEIEALRQEAEDGRRLSHDDSDNGDYHVSAQSPDGYEMQRHHQDRVRHVSHADIKPLQQSVTACQQQIHEQRQQQLYHNQQLLRMQHMQMQQQQQKQKQQQYHEHTLTQHPRTNNLPHNNLLVPGHSRGHTQPLYLHQMGGVARNPQISAAPGRHVGGQNFPGPLPQTDGACDDDYDDDDEEMVSLPQVDGGEGGYIDFASVLAGKAKDVRSSHADDHYTSGEEGETLLSGGGGGGGKGLLKDAMSRFKRTEAGAGNASKKSRANRGNSSIVMPYTPKPVIIDGESVSSPVDWVQCDSCGEWRFFEPGLRPSQVGITWNCAHAGRVCNELDHKEVFMNEWTEICEDDSVAYKFLIEMVEFTVYELYWTVQVHGGYAQIKKWKKVADYLMQMKMGHLTNEEGSKGVNYSGLKQQWADWKLDVYEEKWEDRGMPDRFSQDASVKRRQIGAWQERNERAHHVSKNVTAQQTPQKTERGRGHACGLDTVSPGNVEYTQMACGGREAGYDGGETPRSGRSCGGCERSPALLSPESEIVPEIALSDEERLKVIMSKSSSMIRGQPPKEDAIRRAVSENFLVRLDEMSFRSEPIGTDRFSNNYWRMGSDYSRLWVEKAGCRGWGVLRTADRLGELIDSLDELGIHECALKEALELRREFFEDSMAADQARGSTAQRRGSGAEREEEKKDTDEDADTVCVKIEDLMSKSHKYLDESQPLAQSEESSRCFFGQALYGKDDTPTMKAARDFYGVLEEHCSQQAGNLEVSPVICKLKGDLLLVEMAMKEESVMNVFIERRSEWLEDVKMAQKPAQLHAALEMLVSSVKTEWLSDWYVGIREADQARALWEKHRAEEQMEEEIAAEDDSMIIDEDSDGGEGFVGVAGNSSGRKWGPGRGGPAGDGGPLTTAAVVALALYGFDEAILLDSPREIFVERSVQEASCIAFPHYPYAGMAQSTTFKVPRYVEQNKAAPA